MPPQNPPKRKENPGHNQCSLKSSLTTSAEIGQSGLEGGLPEDGDPLKGDSWRRSIMQGEIEKESLQKPFTVQTKTIQNPSTSFFALLSNLLVKQEHSGVCCVSPAKDTEQHLGGLCKTVWPVWK